MLRGRPLSTGSSPAWSGSRNGSTPSVAPPESDAQAHENFRSFWPETSGIDCIRFVVSFYFSAVRPPPLGGRAKVSLFTKPRSHAPCKPFALSGRGLLFVSRRRSTTSPFTHPPAQWCRKTSLSRGFKTSCVETIDCAIHRKAYIVRWSTGVICRNANDLRLLTGVICRNANDLRLLTGAIYYNAIALRIITEVIYCRADALQILTGVICRNASDLRILTGVIYRKANDLRILTEVICRNTIDLRWFTGVICRNANALRILTGIICRNASDLRILTGAICYKANALRIITEVICRKASDLRWFTLAEMGKQGGF